MRGNISIAKEDILNTDLIMDLRSEIMRRLEAMPLELQHRVLAYFDSLEQIQPRGEKGSALLPFVGLLDDTSAAEMSRAIEAACEVVDSSEW